mmetsp:Transcript_26907/g.47482  ORF Transcript_26907/g.47482 Transcript_26907/m.47482 type:complete len:85 (+) Transcript_26907:97-351(+)
MLYIFACTTQDLYAMLDHILASYRKIEATGFYWDLIGRNSKNMRMGSQSSIINGKYHFRCHFVGMGACFHSINFTSNAYWVNVG